MRKALLILACLALSYPGSAQATQTLTPTQGGQVVRDYWHGWRVLKQSCHNKTPQTVHCITWLRDHVTTEGHTVPSYIIIYSTIVRRGHHVIYKEANGEALI